MAIALGTIYAELGIKLDKFNRGLEQAEEQINQAEKRFEGLSAAGERLSAVGKQMTMGLTLPIVGVAAASVKMATDFNSAMADVATLIPGNVRRVEELKTAVQNMSVETGKRTADLSRGLYQVISAFGDTAGTAIILETNARAAAAGLATTEEAIALTSAVTKGYGDTSAEAVAKAADLALLTVRLGQTTFPELAGSIGRVTPLASAMGMSMEDLFGTMATLTGVTGSAAEVSTQLRGVLQGLMDPSKDMQSALTAMGYASGTAALESLGLQGVLQGLATQTGGNQEQLAGLFGSIEAGTAVLALTGGQADVFSQRLKDMEGYAGATDTAFREQTEGVNASGFALQQMISQLQMAAQQIGDVLLPVISDLVKNYLMPAVMWFSGLDEGTKKVIVTVALLVAALGPLLLVLGFLLSSVANISAGLTVLKGVFGSLKGVLVAKKALFLKLLGPVGLVIAAVTLLALGVRLVMNNWTAITGFFSGLWATVSSIFSRAVSSVTGFISDLWSRATSRFTSMVSSIRQIVAGVTEAISAPFRRASAIVSGITDTIGGFLQRLNPFARSSPSLVDQIRAGVSVIQEEYGKLEHLRLPTLAAAGATPFSTLSARGQAVSGQEGGSGGQFHQGPLFTVQNMVVRNEADIDAISRSLHRQIQAATRARGGR